MVGLDRQCMNDLPPATHTLLPALLCNAIVYRALLRKNWIDKNTGRIQSAAFFRRPKDTGNDLDGLSVSIAAACSIEDARGGFTSCYGIATLHVGRVRDIGLDVQPDSPIHANITGLPCKEDNLIEAERLAGLLARQARIAWQPL